MRTETHHKFARRVFLFAGWYGVLALLPQYFMETKTGLDFPPPITHPEYFYGFIGVGLAWQVAFLIIAKNPVRFRAIMIPGILEKVSFGIAAIVLYAQGRMNPLLLGAGCFDLVLAALFAASYVKVGAEKTSV